MTDGLHAERVEELVVARVVIACDEQTVAAEDRLAELLLDLLGELLALVEQRVHAVPAGVELAGEVIGRLGEGVRPTVFPEQRLEEGALRLEARRARGAE